MKISRSHTTPQFEKDFISLPKTIRQKVERKIKLFEENCFYPSLKTHKLKVKIFGHFLLIKIIVLFLDFYIKKK